MNTTDVECKAAQGRDSRGEVPASIYESYSAMANSAGGDIYLGVEETTDHRLVCKGIKDIQKVRKAFWDTINSTQKVSKNVLTDSDVEILSVNSLSILHIHVPRARVYSLTPGFSAAKGELPLNTDKEPTTTTQENTQEKIVQLLRTRRNTTRNELAHQIGISPDGINYHLKILKSKGLIRHIGPTKASYWEILEK